MQNNNWIIFISAVSDEFHNCPKELQHTFLSYRVVLEKAFKKLDGKYRVITRENLRQGVRDLLHTLEDNIAESILIVHLVGESAGEIPVKACLDNLRARHHDLLARLPELKTALDNDPSITYTQWEIYLALHHDKPRLVMLAQSNSRRSPNFKPDESSRASQERHFRRLEFTGAHRCYFSDQGDIARKVIRSFVKAGLDEAVDPIIPQQKDLDEAVRNSEKIMEEIIAFHDKPNSSKVLANDPANAVLFIEAWRACAQRWRVNLKTIVDIQAETREVQRVAAEQEPTPGNVFKLARAELAGGDYTAAMHAARRAADGALSLRQLLPMQAESYRQAAIKTLQLFHSAASAANEKRDAIAALEEASPLVDREKEPILWADIHEPLADFFVDHAKLDRADELISEIIDIREEKGEENPFALAKSLLLWTKLLLACEDYQGMEHVAARAEKIAAKLGDSAGIAAAQNQRAVALHRQNQIKDAELLMRHTLVLHEHTFGREHPSVAIVLHNLARLLSKTDRLAEAELLIRRALAIDESNFDPEHPTIAVDLNTLGGILIFTNRLAEAEPLLVRALAINEKNLGPKHPQVAWDLCQLANTLEASHRVSEAESLKRRAVSIAEQNSGPEAPLVALYLNNLVVLLIATNRLPEAEPLMRRALQIVLNSCRISGRQHPDLQTFAENYAQLLSKMEWSNADVQAEIRALAEPVGIPIQVNISQPATIDETVKIFQQRADYFQRKGDYDQAEAVVRQALQMFCQNAQTPSTSSAVVAKFAKLLEKMGRGQPETQAQLNAIGKPFGIKFDSSK